MREVNHRAKNMLSVVDSIAHQTATRNPEGFIERFSERMVRSDWEGVEIADLTRAQLAHFADLIDSRIVVDGPRLRLKPASAQAIGLALHELATNAGEYGALSTGRGRVRISWRTDGDTFAMSWTERDGPPAGSAPSLWRRWRSAVWMASQTQLCAARPDLALDLPGSKRASAPLPILSRKRGRVGGSRVNRSSNGDRSAISQRFAVGKRARKWACGEPAMTFADTR
jgi:hypothetical protein